MLDTVGEEGLQLQQCVICVSLVISPLLAVFIFACVLAMLCAGLSALLKMACSRSSDPSSECDDFQDWSEVQSRLENEDSERELEEGCLALQALSNYAHDANQASKEGDGEDEDEEDEEDERDEEDEEDEEDDESSKSDGTYA